VQAVSIIISELSSPMSAQTRISERDKWLRVFVAATWALYALTFIPFSGEYVIQWLFAFAAALGVALVVITILGLRIWRIAAIVLAILVLVLYVDYWVWITDNARSSKPELASPLALGHVLEQGWRIFQHQLSSGATFSALKVIYFEQVMPALQLVLIAVLLLLRGSAPARPVNASPA
jgi:hypothetical protein